MHYGLRAKIGLITPANGTANEMDFHRLAPDGVAMMTQRIFFEKVDIAGLSDLADRAVEGAKILSNAKPDLLVFGCTTGSLIGGFGYDKELTGRIEKASGIKTITTATAVIEALKALGSRRILVSTPYSDEVNTAEKKFLEDSGFEVAAIHGLGYTDPNMMPTVTVEQMYKLTSGMMDASADTIFISCTGISVLDGIQAMETDFKRPVITSNQVSLWHALRLLSINDDTGLGVLFQK